jgi:hypothetical protein
MNSKTACGLFYRFFLFHKENATIHLIFGNFRGGMCLLHITPITGIIKEKRINLNIPL